MSWYSIGSVSVATGSAIVTGTGSAWFGALQQGWGFVGPDGRAYEIASVNSDTQITLKVSYAGTTATGATYASFPTMSLASELVAKINVLIADYQNALDGVEFGYTPDITGNFSDRGDYDAELRGFAYLAVDTGQLFFKNSNTSGDWSAGIEFGRGDKGDKGDTGEPGPASTVPGPKGDGWTGASYNAATGIVTFASTNGLGFVTGDLRGTPGAAGLGWSGVTYNPADGKLTFASSQGLGYVSADIRGATGNAGWSPVFALQADGARSVLKVTDWTGGAGTKPASNKYVGATGLVPAIGDGLDVRGATGADSTVAGPKGDGWTGGTYASGIVTFTSADGLGFATGDLRGENGWMPVFAIVADSERRVFQVTDWTGGTGTKPATGGYIGSTGLVVAIADGIDVRGATGAAGAGTGDMLVATYDPTGKSGDAFARANHTGTQAFSTITGAGTAASLNVPASGNAAAGEVVKGSDTRLTDARTPTTHTHTKSQIADFPTLGTASAQDVGYFATAAQGALAGTAVQPGSLATVATSGAYASLSGLPSLGTASVQNVGYFATASHTHTLSSITDAGTAAAQNVGYFATAAQGANGVTAYGWGNHAAAGYLTSIANDAVTNAKLANMATSTIKGRVTGSTGDPEDLTGAQVLGIIGTSTAGEIAALTGTKPVVPTAVATLFTRATPSGGSNYAPDFATTRIATWIPTANRVFSNPVNAVPGATIEVKLYASSSTERTVTFGSYYVGDLPTLLIEDTVKYSVFIYCVSATEFVVTAKRLQ